MAAVEAGHAVIGIRFSQAFPQLRLRQEEDGVGADLGRDLLRAIRLEIELLPGGDVDAVVAGPMDLRGGKPEVDLARAGLLQEAGR